MKKTLLTMAAAIALVGCSQEDLLTGQQDGNVKGAVGANIFVPTTTRGAALDNVTHLQTSENGFDLISYYHDSEWTHFMGQADDGIEFKYSDGVWDYANRGEMSFWQDVPEGATDLKFFAVSPTKDKLPDNSSYSIGAETSHITYQVPEDVSEQVDLMFAQTDVADDEYESTSAIYNNGVPLYFHHALSQILFQARIDEKDADANDPTVSTTVTAYVNSITLRNVYGSGEFDMDGASAILGNEYFEDPNLNNKEEYTNALWSTSGEKTASYEITSLMNNTGITSIEPLTLTDGEVNGEETAMLLIPQQLEALSLEGVNGNVSSVNDEQFQNLVNTTGTYLEVSCRVEFNGSAIVGDKEATEDDPTNYYDKLYIPINTNWNPGYKYVYTLVFGAESGDPVKAYVETVDQWSTPNGTGGSEGGENGGENNTTQESTLSLKVGLEPSFPYYGDDHDYMDLISNSNEAPTIQYSSDNSTWHESKEDAGMGWVTVAAGEVEEYIPDEYSLRRSAAKKSTEIKTRSANGGYVLRYNFSIAALDEATETTDTYLQALKNNPVKGDEWNPFDLSYHDIYGKEDEDYYRNTANCYVVNAAGWYQFPVVYGNAIKDDEKNSSAFNTAATYSGNYVTYIEETSQLHANSANLLWESTNNLISNVSLEEVNDTYYSHVVKFKVDEDNLNEGNAVIVVKNGSNEILWSWHIWVTPVDLRPVVTNNSTGASAMPVNLGWVSDGSSTTTVTHYAPREGYVKFTKDGKEVVVTVNQLGYCYAEGAISGSQPYYQWGRKDPFVSDKYTSEGSGSLLNAIANPSVFYTSTSGDWFGYAGSNANLWNSSVSANNTTDMDATVKTIFDPCPPGFAVAPATAYNDFNSNSAAWNNGFTYSVSDRNIYFPVSNKLGSTDGNIDESDGCGFCWGSTLNMTTYSMAVGFKYGEGEYNYDQDMNLQVGAGYPVRPVVESSNE